MDVEEQDYLLNSQKKQLEKWTVSSKYRKTKSELIEKNKTRGDYYNTREVSETKIKNGKCWKESREKKWRLTY